jgi:glycosyltransferase involved in cell wall biosynthesis
MLVLATGYRCLADIGDVPEWDHADAPLVSVIVPACNEEDTIEAGLRSLCSQSYPNLEIIVVNDRSTDRTGEIIESIRQEHPQVKLITLHELPAGWLGKPHALEKGAGQARGDYFLFTDADIHHAETTISRVVRKMQVDRFDHLSLIFQNRGGGLLLNVLISDVGAGLLLLLRPWKAKDIKSRVFTGVGAFNMVRSSVYRAIGGHEPIRMQVIDDVFIGKLIKWGGYSQDCLLARNHVTVQWYATISEMIDGLMKNVFALFHYRFIGALGGIVLIVLVVIAPVWGVFLVEGTVRMLFLGAALIRLAGIGAGIVLAGLPPYGVLYLLVTPYITLYVIGRAVWTTYRSGGITWRGRFYPLAELRTAEWLFSGMFTKKGREDERNG